MRRPAGGGLQRCRTLAAVAVSDRDPEEIRRTLTYRSALWCARLMYVSALTFVVTQFVSSFRAFVWLPWLVGLLFAVASLVLLHRPELQPRRVLATSPACRLIG